jgi:Amino acid transporters
MSDKNITTIENKEQLKRDLGLFSATAIGVSQMIGTGIYMAPQGLASMSNPTAALLGCIIVGIGTLLMALSFGRIGEKIPVSGSAIVYTKAAFGDTASFIVGWSYWWSNLLGISAIAIGTLAYGAYFIPGLADNKVMIFVAGSAIIWLYTLINIRGIKGAGKLNLVLTIIKLVPLLVFFIVAAIHFDASNMQTISDPKLKGMGVLPIAIGYLMWSFMGFEGSSINAGEVKDKSIVKKATVLCAVSVIIIYIIFIILATGSMGQADLAKSTSPVAEIITRTTGAGWAGAFIALGVFISGLGCVGAWIISSARITYAVGEQGLFPKSFAKVHAVYKTPVNALIIDAIICTLILAMNFSKSLVNAYNFLILLTTLSSLIFYAFGVASEIMLLKKREKEFNVFNFIKNSFFSLVAFAYAVYAIYGCGADYAMYGLIFIMVGIPFFIYVKYQRGEVTEIREAAGLAAEEGEE